MARTYSYKARDRNGQLLSGNIIAETEAAVAAYIRNKGYFVTQIKVNDSRWKLRAWLDSLQRISSRELAVFCRQFAAMLDAGIALLSCLKILVDQAQSPKLKAALITMHKKIQEGEMLSRAMAEHKDVFSNLMIKMIEAGEMAGLLDEILTRLAIHYEREHKFKERVVSALLYPGFVVGLAIVCVVFVLTYILPVFIKLFTSMQIELPLPTRLLLELSKLLLDSGLWLLISLTGFSCSMAVLASRPKIRLVIDQGLLRLPLFGALWRKMAIARFCRTLATMVRSGVPILAALEVVKQTMGNLSITQTVSNAQASIRHGFSLAAPLGANTVFPPMVIQMIAIGEETGQLDKMLEKIADFYESDIDDLAGRLSSMLEPLLIGGLGVIVGFIVLSILLPVFDIVTSFPQ